MSGSSYCHIVKLGRIYRAYPAMRTGEYHTIIIRNQQILFSKETGGQTIYIALNLSEGDFDLNFNTPMGALVDVISSKPVEVNNGNAYVKMPPFSSMIIVSDDIVNTEPEPTPETSEEPATEAVAGAKYHDINGREVEVLSIARHTETQEELVIYKLLENGSIWAQPKSLFTGKDGEKNRFTMIK